MTCLFCNGTGLFNTIEHIIPESLGNDDLLLEKQVCDKCQNYLSQIENYVLSHTPIGFWRTFLSIKTKRGRLPQANFSKKGKPGGKIPDAHPAHDNVSFIAHKDFSTEVILPEDYIERALKEGSGKLKYVMTPKVIHELGRFLGKIGLELICKENAHFAKSAYFDLLRNYVRQGFSKELWPIFHTTTGTIQDLYIYKTEGEVIKEDVVCYSYKLQQIESYLLFNLTVGIDGWFICLNEMYPTPVILQAAPNQKLDLIWYPGETWKL